MLRSIRKGFATNSSSAHSIILHRPDDPRIMSGFEATPAEIAPVENFVFRTKRDKAIYILLGDPMGAVSAHTRLRFVKCLKRHGLEDTLAQLDGRNFNFDTMSASHFYPLNQGGVDFETWFDFMMSDEITIYGYNDNYENPGRSLVIEGAALDIHAGLRWKKDGAALVAYSPHNGTKLRWSPEPYEKSTTPELIDLKITNYCGHRCSFCYQGSTASGQHAPLERVKSLLDACAGMQTFEIALGGGEPVSHPGFAEILTYGAARGLTMNFTAYGIGWLRNAAILAAIRNCTKGRHGIGIGVSVHRPRDIVKIDRVNAAVSGLWMMGLEVTAQTVVGAGDPEILDDLMEACVRKRTGLLLLGYKRVGRGRSFPAVMPSRKQMERFLRRARSQIEEISSPPYERGFRLGVDTAFLDQYGDILNDIGVPHILRSSPEGKFSMYLDAVTNTCGPSSYCDPDLMEPVVDLPAQFARW